MQLNTNRKKLIIILLSVGVVLLGGVATVYALKYTQNKQSQQQSDKEMSQKNNDATALQKEKAADKAFIAGDLQAAKTLYQEVIGLYVIESNTEGAERAKMQLSLIELQLKTIPENTQPIDASSAPVDRKLNAQLGQPATPSKQ